MDERDGGSRRTAWSGEYSRRYVVLVLVFCAGSSLGAIFINKATLTHYNFHYPFALMLLQTIFTVFILFCLSTVQPRVLTLTTIHARDYLRALIPTVLFLSNVTVGLWALALVNIPMFSAFRRLTVLFVMTAEYIILRKSHSRGVVISVIFLTAGAFVSALGDVTFSALGYALVFLNNALTAMYLASIKRLMKDLSLDPLSLLYHTALLGMPIVLLICVFTGEFSQALYDFVNRPELHTVYFLGALTFVAASAFCVNYSTSLCTHVTSPLTTAVTGQVKNVLQTFLGFFSWGYVPTKLNVAGLMVAMLGQIAFAWFKQEESRPLGLPSGSSGDLADGAARGKPRDLSGAVVVTGMEEGTEMQTFQVRTSVPVGSDRGRDVDEDAVP